LLKRSGAGFGLLGLTGALLDAGLLSAATQGQLSAAPHFAPLARRVIFLFMNGGPSHVDTFDPKPALAKHEGETPSGTLHKKPSGGYKPSPFAFRPHGQSGVVMSELFPRLSQCADDLCVLRGMHTDVPNHEPGLLLMHSGNQQPVRPSLGSWVTYGLGTENNNLPSYVALSPGRPVVGPQLWSNSFLPGEFQATALNTEDMRVEKLVANLRHPHLARHQQRQQLDLVQSLNRIHQDQHDHDPRLEAQIRSMELAFQMQSAASEAFDISLEPEVTREMYGDSLFGRSCLLARRLTERGVRFVQVYYVTPKNKQPWDTHTNNDDGHRKLCADSDRGTAALLSDLKRQGLLDETLVIWGGEFGRTPYAQIDKKKNKPGRDHHHTGFSIFMAGGGVRGGMMHGNTDEFGMHAVEGRVHIHDLHATILHLLGMNHEQLTFRYSGRDFRLTDVHGRVVEDVVA
jgi:hypothetical protein